jgi:hypothetical protein
MHGATVPTNNDTIMRLQSTVSCFSGVRVLYEFVGVLRRNVLFNTAVTYVYIHIRIAVLFLVSGT